MPLLSRVRKISQIALHPDNLICPARYLFIFSHMRSRSSVLSHILGSNPEICGYGELHSSYESMKHFLKLRVQLNADLGCSLRDKYLLDKLLHNTRVVSDEVIAKVNPKVIFLLREPESTIKSIMNMGVRQGNERWQDPIKAAKYYTDRVLGMRDYAEKLSNGYFFLESDELVDNTDSILARMSTWLELKEPLSKEYETFSQTGRAGHGDTSTQIQSGNITKTDGYPDITLPQEALDQGVAAYEACRSRLLDSGDLP